MQSPLSKYLYSVLPLPTLGEVNPAIAANYFGLQPTREDQKTYTLRVDHRIGDSDQIYGRITLGDKYLSNRRDNEGGTPISLDRLYNFQETPERSHNAIFAWNHVFAPTFFVETLLTGSNLLWQYQATSPGYDEDVAARLNLPNPFKLNGGPNFTGVGFGVTMRGITPRDQDTRAISFEQNYTRIVKTHQIDFGGRFRREDLDVLPDQPAQSGVSFGNLGTALYDPATQQAFGTVPRTAHNAADMFLGIASSYAQTRPSGRLIMGGNEMSLYAQDNWKISSRLTVKLGVRWEYLPAYVDRNGLLAAFDLKSYERDTAIPKHRIRWNFLADLPFGRGKLVGRKAGPWMNRLIGGWQLAGTSSMQSRWWDLPTTNWGQTNPTEIYGFKYKVEDCRSGRCIPGYLYYNGYIPANRINSVDPVTGNPNGVMGVPAGYRPAHSPITPIPAQPVASNDPLAAFYETNNVNVPLKDGTVQRTGFDNGLHPWLNQHIAAPWSWSMNASLFKAVPITEGVNLRVSMDFFNVLNMPGLTLPNSSSGILSLQDSSNGPRELQWTVRLTF